MKSDKTQTELNIVNRSNFLIQIQYLKHLIESLNYRFIIFNAEYSNLTNTDESYFDSIEERYMKIIKKINEGNTSLIYFELVLFKIENNEFNKKVFKFPIMKRSKFSDEKNLSIHKSTADYFYVFRNKFFNINDSFNQNSITYEMLKDKQKIERKIETVLRFGKPMDKKGLNTKFYFFPKEIKFPNRYIQSEIKDLFIRINEFVLDSEKKEESFQIKNKEIFDRLFSFNFSTIYKSSIRNYLSSYKSLSFQVEIKEEFEERIQKYCKSICSTNISEHNIDIQNNEYFKYVFIGNKSTDKASSLENYIRIIKGFIDSGLAHYEFPGFNFDIYSFFNKEYFTIKNVELNLTLSKNTERNDLYIKSLINYDVDPYELYCKLFLNMENEKEILFEDKKDINFNFLFERLLNIQNQRNEQNSDEILLPEKFREEIILLNDLISDEEKDKSLLKLCLFCEIEKDNKKYKLKELIRDFDIINNIMKVKINPDSNQLDIIKQLAPLYEKKISENLIQIKKQIFLTEEMGFSEIFNFLFLKSKKVVLMAHNVFLQMVLLYNILDTKTDFDTFKRKEFPKFIDLNYLNKKSEKKLEMDYKEGVFYTENLLNCYEKIFRSKTITQANNITDNQLNDGLEKFFHYFIIANNTNEIACLDKNNIEVSSMNKNCRKLVITLNKNEYNKVLAIIKSNSKSCFIYNCTKINENKFENVIEFIEDVDQEILTNLNKLIKELN
jgi:hypothetical protein